MEGLAWPGESARVPAPPCICPCPSTASSADEGNFATVADHSDLAAFVGSQPTSAARQSRAWQILGAQDATPWP